MEAIIDYLTKHRFIGIAFTRIPRFYEKFGFVSDKKSLKQLVYLQGEQEFLNTTDEYVVYFDPEDILVTKIFQHPEKKVILPRFPDW